MSEHICATCGMQFPYACYLTRHLNKKNKCVPPPSTPYQPATEDNNTNNDDKLRCKNCHFLFTRRQNLHRHSKKCQPNPTDTLNEKIDMLTRQIENLTAMQATLMPLALSNSGNNVSVRSVTGKTAVGINNGAVNNIEVNINVTPFGTEMQITLEQIRRFCEKSRSFQAYQQLDDNQRLDIQEGGKYIPGIVMDALIEVHTNPAYRNVRIHPNRSDQTQVYAGGGPVEDQNNWITQELLDTSLRLADDIVTAVRKTAMDGYKSIEDIANSVLIAVLTFEGNPDQFIAKLKHPMQVHLTNLATCPGYPAILTRGPSKV